MDKQTIKLLLAEAIIARKQLEATRERHIAEGDIGGNVLTDDEFISHWFWVEQWLEEKFNVRSRG